MVEKVEKVGKVNNKLRIGLLTPISQEWLYLHSDKVELVKTVDEAKYIIYESNGDPIHSIMKVKECFPKNKLVFILSGDQSMPIDNECIWFSNAVKSAGLALKQTQIFVTNPAIFKYYESNKMRIENKIANLEINSGNQVYFKGTIWNGMRTDMYNFFKDKPNCKIIENNKYWSWRLGINKPLSKEIEDMAFESYEDIFNSIFCLCPKGNGNSSMRIIEALACGNIPILINDFSKPFNNEWTEIALVFDTCKHNWNYIYSEIMNILLDNDKVYELRRKGYEYFKSVIYSDARLPGFKMYKDINTVCFGFSGMIIDKLISD
jgi:hypothetical protein